MSRAVAALGAGLLALLALGCASPAKRPPAEPSLPALPAGGFAAAERAGALEASAWWRELGGPELDELVREALRRNHDLEAAASRVEAAAAQARIAGAALRPRAAAGLAGERGRRNFVGLPVPGGEDVLSSTSTSVGVSLDVSWELDVWGRLKAGRLAALEDLAAAEARLDGARESLAAQVGKAWLALRESEAQLELARDTAASYRLSADRLEERYRLGLVAALDLRLARSNAAGAGALTARREQQREAAVRQLEVLLGRYPAGALEGAGELPEAPGPLPAGLPAELLGRRPDLRAQAARVRASGLRVSEARRARRPSLSLTASGGTASDDLSDLVDLDFRVWNLAANLLAPILQGGRLRAAVDLSEAREDEAVAAFAGGILRALGEVETLLAAESALRRRELAVAEDVGQARAARELAEEQYRRGLVDIVTVLEARRRALAAEAEALAVRRERLDARIDLHLALGGGLEAAAAAPDAESVEPESRS